MRHTRSFNSQSGTVRPKFHLALSLKHYSVALCLFAMVFATNLGWAAPQQAPAKGARNKTISSQPNWNDELNKYPGLVEEYGRLLTRFQREIKLPPPRSQSRLLRLMPQSMTAYGAIPNYGAAVHQGLDIFQQELKDSTPLRNWWQHNQVGSKGPNIETVLKRYYQLSEYLGDEVVGSGIVKENGGGLVFIAEVKKPGVEEFLRSTVKELAGQSVPPQVLNLKELATAQDPDDKPVILVRPDFVIFSSDLKTLRSFNSKLSSGGPMLDTTAFGKRLSESYQRGVDVLMAADLHSIIGQMPKDQADNQRTLQRSGFADAKYAIWEYADVTGQASSQAELSFSGQRHGVASWLAAPGRLGGLDFVSPDAGFVMSVLLKSPAEIYADIKELTNSPNPQDPQKLASMEPFLLPILSQLTGDITIEVNPIASPSTRSTASTDLSSIAEWKVIFGARDANALHQMLSLFLAGLRPREIVENGDTYYLAQIPNANKPTEFSYSFQQGYVVVGSSQKVVAKALLAHRSGESLGRSERYRAALPPGHTTDASAIMYQNSAGLMNPMFSQLPPEIMKRWLPSSAQGGSVINALYGEETAIRSASNSGTSSVAPVLIVAAIAIPNLLRSRVAANEASALDNIRALNVAQITYASTYPKRGFARDLATLGRGLGQSEPSAARAQLLDSTLACSSGTAGNWCIKSGYKFTVHTDCTQKGCDQYVQLATPVSTSTGQRTFCATEDGVIHFKAGPPLTSVISASECKSWRAIR